MTRPVHLPGKCEEFKKLKLKKNLTKFVVMSAAVCRWMTVKVTNIPKQWVRVVQTTHFARKILGCTTLGVAIAKCNGILDVKNSKEEVLTHEQCLKQACLLSVNSASTLLTTTSSVLLDICKQYKDSLNKILSLLEELRLVGGENQALWDEIVEARADVNKAKATLTELNSFMESVEKVVNSTTEATFLAGAEYMCTALCERLYSAQREINNQLVELKKLEEDYVKLQREIVKKESDAKGNVSKKQETPVNSQSKHFL